MTLHDFYGLWSDLEYHFDWKTEDDTHKHTAGSLLCGLCINKQGVGSHSTKTNPNCQTAQLLTMSLCCCLHAHFSQLSSDTPRPSQALKTHSTPFFTSSSAVFHLDVSGLDSDIDHCCRLRASSPSCDKSFPDSQML